MTVLTYWSYRSHKSYPSAAPSASILRRRPHTPPPPISATSAIRWGFYVCMKITPLRSVTIALVAMAVASYPSITQAAKPSPSPSVATTTGKQAPESADQRLADMKKQVNLTKAQEAKVKPIVEKYVSDRNALNSDATASKSDKNSKKEALRKQYNSDVNAVLTPDQQQKWAAAKKEMFQPKQAAAASPSPSAKKK
jgi:periplasmic protein CpxP/Spy